MTAATITMVDRATVARIREEHEACERAAGESLQHAIACGRLLAQVKAQLGHGEWTGWVEEHFPASMRTAQTYMQLAAAPEEDTQRVARLPLRQARDEIATPRPGAEALRQLGGGRRSPEIERRLEEARARRETDTERLWSDAAERKLTRGVEQLEGVLSKLDDAKNTTSLARHAVGEILRRQAVEVRQAASVLDDLAFSFER